MTDGTAMLPALRVHGVGQRDVRNTTVGVFSTRRIILLIHLPTNHHLR